MKMTCMSKAIGAALMCFGMNAPAAIPDESGIAVTLYVDAQSAQADDGNDGADPAKPLLTFREAVNKTAEKIKVGVATRVLLKPGVYRETSNADLKVADNELFKSTLLVIEGEEKGEVIINGAERDGWEPETWTLVDAGRKIYRHDWSPNWGLHSEGYYSPPNILLHRREIVFINGERLQPAILEQYNYTDPKGRIYNEVGLLIEENPNAEGGYDYVGYRNHEALEPGQFGVAELTGRGKL